MNEKDTKSKYADIIGLEYRPSPNRPQMSLHNRAAQFAPFAALSGYDEMVTEEARLTESEITLSDSEIDIINGVITKIGAIINCGGHPTSTVTYFKPDAHKAGGSYETLTGIVKRVDTVEKKLVFYGSENIEDRRIPTEEILMERIIAVSLHLPSEIQM